MPQGPSTPSKKRLKSIPKVLKETFKGPENDVFWHPAMTTYPPSNYTPGFVPVLKSWLAAAHSRGEIRKAVLCFEQTVYIQKEAWNATWGCGYLNFLMMCAALMVQSSQPMYFPLLDEPVPPGVRNLQKWIEMAWDAGYDPEGKKDLKNLIGTSRWIGTADIWVALSARGIPSNLIDFDATKSTGVQPLIDWTVKYFNGNATDNAPARSAFEALQGNPVVSTQLMPFILQHKGHSRLIVGYEVNKQGGINLLTFDCGNNLNKSWRNHALSQVFSKTAGNGAGQANQTPLKRRLSGSAEERGNASIKRSRSEPEDDDVVEMVAKSTTKPQAKDDSDDEIEITGFKSPSKPSAAMPIASKPKPVEKPVTTAKDLQEFRITQKALEKHKQYQILWFPMTEPLSEQQRLRRKMPTATKM